MDVDGDGVVTYDEFKEMVGPKKFNLGLVEKDVKDLIVVCDPDGNGIIECDEFLRAMMTADDGDGKDVFIDYPAKMIDDMIKTVEQHESITPAHIQTSVDLLAPLPASSIPTVDPRTEKEIRENDAQRRQKMQRRMRKALMMQNMNKLRTPDWQDLAQTHKTV